MRVRPSIRPRPAPLPAEAMAGADILPRMPPALAEALLAAVPADRVLTRPIERIAFASDASFYRLVPRAVVLASTVDEVRALLRVSHTHRVPLTLRAAGTSLAGQSVTDGLLVEVARHWKRIDVEDEGRRVRVQPGAIGGQVNAALRPFGARIGPDPASINACTLGGILANNSSGMCCGVEQNAYHTLESLTFVLPSGTTIDTAAPDADAQFRGREPRLAAGLLDLKGRIDAQPALRDRIRAKYRMKNTTGYGLNAFLDFERPVDIMRHLLVGSEGTLAFIAEAVLRTVPDLPFKYTGLLLFPHLHAACAAIVPLRDAGARALELMDRAALRSVESRPGVPSVIAGLPAGVAGLLVEMQAREDVEREALAARANGASAGLPLVAPALYTRDAAEQARLWTVRQGMFPSVGAVRRSGTTVIIEDVAFPVEALADATVDLTTLFARHAYPDAIVFGHAKDGNLHFVLTQAFATAADVDQYARLMDDVVALVVERYDGALKGEHGTGRNMAPFVEAEWGSEAAAIMRQLKTLVDPEGLLNPGVIVNDDPQAHLKHLKPLPPVEPEVDACIECGYCESKCPSRELSFTPRQRIVVRREMARRAAGRDEDVLRDLRDGYGWMAIETCAADGMCATACPVDIDTGALVKRLRGREHSPRAREAARWCAEHFDLVESGMRAALRTGHAIERIGGDAALVRLTDAVRALGLQVPRWASDVPCAALSWRKLLQSAAPFTVSSHEAAAVYFPACITRTLGESRHASRGPGHGGAVAGEAAFRTLPDVLAEISARAGRRLYIPDDAPGTCCGVPFSSKGFDTAHRVAANRAIERMWRWSGEGRLPIVIDTSPCAFGLKTCRETLDGANRRRFDRLRLLDCVEFVHDELLPRLSPRALSRHSALHPVCSLVKMHLDGPLEAVARQCSARVLVPREAGCCGFAGDRGFLVPELTASATRHEADEVSAAGCDAHYSSSRTCEIGMMRATGRDYRSFVFLVEEATR